MTLIEHGFAHPAKAEELTAAVMSLDVDALLTSCEAKKTEEDKGAEEAAAAMGVNTPPDTPGVCMGRRARRFLQGRQGIYLVSLQNTKKWSKIEQGPEVQNLESRTNRPTAGILKVRPTTFVLPVWGSCSCG